MADYNNDVNNDWVEGGCMDSILIYLGYRFVLQEATFQKELAANGNFDFTLSLKNVGYTGISKDRPVHLVLKNTVNGNSYTYAINTDIRTWINEVTIDESIDLDEAMEPGDYQCYLHLPDGAESIRDRPKFAIQLGNIGVWEEETGYNDLNYTMNGPYSKITALEQSSHEKQLPKSLRLNFLNLSNILPQRIAMIGTFSGYSIEKTDKKFLLPNGEELAQTANISIWREKEKIIATLELGVVNADILYERIANKQSIYLDKCYIENFSLATFRKKRNIEQDRYVEIKEFVLTNSVFHADQVIDFSFAKFSSGHFDVSHSIFLQGGINFDHSDFRNGDFKFDNAYFHHGGARFSNATFDKGLLSFKNSKFKLGNKDLRQDDSRREGRRRRNKGILNFESATFGEGKIDFTRSNLGSGDINFSNANLNKRDVLFVGAEFNAVRLNFRSVNCKNGKLDFHFANFRHGDLFFDRATFNKGNIDFSATEFERGKISFNRTEFKNNELIFESCEIENGRIIFKNNLFGTGALFFNSAQCRSANILFENVDFGKYTATFFRARVNTLSFKSCHLNAFFNLQLKECNTLDFSNSVVRDIVDMNPYGFTTNLQFLNLSGLLLLGHFYIDWKTNRVKELILNQKTSHRDRSEQFRILKENYRTMGQYDAEDEAYVQFRRSEAKADLEDAKASGDPLRKVRATTAHGFKWLIFDKIGLYATNPVRVLISMIFTYLFFVFVYYLIPFSVGNEIKASVDHGDHLSKLGIAFYHSVITFLTIGYGDYYPTGVFRWISGFEGFMGLFLISYFTVAFVRKVLR